MKKEEKQTYVCKKDEPICGLCEVGHQQLDNMECHLHLQWYIHMHRPGMRTFW